jgi:hypothetical protein
LIISIVDPSYSQKAVEQKTTGNQSPNINAPSAKSIAITYGIPEKVVSEWIEQLKKQWEAKDTIIESVIEHLLEELKGKDRKIEKMEAIIQDMVRMNAALERRLAERPPNDSMQGQGNKRIDPLAKFTHQEFIDNFIVFRYYYGYRTTLVLLNPDKLVEVLNIYFRSVLLYPSSELKKYYITASDGRLLLLQIEGRNEKDEKILISLPELSPSLLKDTCTDFVKSANPAQYEMLIELFNRALASPELDKIQKSNILDAQTFILKNRLFRN